jgi:hypothetical protein
MGTLAPHSYKGVGTAGEANRSDEDTQFMGHPDGPEQFIPELGMEVGTFINVREDLRLPKDSGMSWLMHHVPRSKRGYYRPHQYPEAFRADNAEWVEALREDTLGYTMCTMQTRQGTDCKRRAVNYAGKCQAHGGKLHPLDKVVDERRMEMAGRSANGNKAILAAKPQTSEETLARMTRFQKFLSGFIKVEELDDEEIARGQLRDKNGGFSATAPAMIPTSLKDQMMKELFKRGDQIMRDSYLAALTTLQDISVGSAYEPADRIKASTYLIERLAGKTPDVVVHTQDKPWEVVMSGIAGGSRAASRAARGIADEEELLEAEVVELGDLVDDEPVAEDVVWDEPEPEEPDPLAIPEPTHEGVEDLPDRDPVRRSKEVRNAAELARREAMKKARNKRFASRAKGLEHIEAFPFEVKTTKGEEGYCHQFIEPKLKNAPKSRGNDDFRHRI